MPAVGRGSVRRTALRLRRFARRLWADRSGIAAVEFGILATPFLMLMLGITSVSVYYFQVSTVETSAQQAARAIRTGQMQQSQGSYSGLTTDAAKKAAFLSVFCANASVPNCSSKTAIIIQSSTAFSSLTTPSCATNGSLVSNASTAFSPGGSNSVVMVTVCYPWAPVGGMPFAKLGNLSDGSFLVQATVAFRTEPY